MRRQTPIFLGIGECAGWRKALYRERIDTAIGSGDTATIREWLDSGRVEGSTGDCREYAIRYLTNRLAEEREAGRWPPPVLGGGGGGAAQQQQQQPGRTGTAEEYAAELRQLYLDRFNGMTWASTGACRQWVEARAAEARADRGAPWMAWFNRIGGNEPLYNLLVRRCGGTVDPGALPGEAAAGSPPPAPGAPSASSTGGGAGLLLLGLGAAALALMKRGRR